MRFRTLIQCLIVGMAFPAMAGNWPAWRGVDATGISDEKGLPVHWSNTENIRTTPRRPIAGHRRERHANNQALNQSSESHRSNLLKERLGS